MALCRILLEKPDLLLLDEPTNHLDAESVAWLEQALQDYAGTVVSITHDRYFLDNVAGVDPRARPGRGRSLEGQLLQLAGAEAEAAGDGGEGREPRGRSSSSASWSGCGRAREARQAKSKARLAAYEELRPARPREARRRRARSSSRRGRKLGGLVVEARGVRKAYGDRLLIDDLNFKLPPGGIVGVIGPNGAGKTTLFRMITGQEKPDAGELPHRRDGEAGLRGPEPRRARRREDASSRRSRAGSTTSTSAGHAVPSRAYLAGFTFKGADQQKRVKDLSGGERNRVHLAKMLKSGGNLLLLDEPTNDLDVETLRSLEEALLDLRRLRGGHQPRPLVPRPDRDAHPRVRRGQPGVLLRGELRGLRGGQEEAPRRRVAPADAHQVQAARPRVIPAGVVLTTRG